MVSDFQLEGSEVTIPPQVLRHSTHPPLVASMSQDSCFSSEGDQTALISLHADPSQDQAQKDDIIPVVMAMDNNSSEHTASSSFLRQLSEPLPPSMVRQVLYGSSYLDGKGHTSLSRHRSLFDRPRDSITSHGSSLKSASSAIEGEHQGVTSYLERC